MSAARINAAQAIQRPHGLRTIQSNSSRQLRMPESYDKEVGDMLGISRLPGQSVVLRKGALLCVITLVGGNLVGQDRVKIETGGAAITCSAAAGSSIVIDLGLSDSVVLQVQHPGRGRFKRQFIFDAPADVQIFRGEISGLTAGRVA